MGKSSELPINEKPPAFVGHDSAQVPKRRRSIVAALVVLSLFFLHTVRFACSPDSVGFLTIEERAYKILKENPLVDGHNDLLITIRMNSSSHINSADFRDEFEKGGYASHVDLPRLDAGMQGGAFWSAFMPCPVGGSGTDFSDDRYESIVRATLEQLDLFNRLGQRYPKYFTPSHDSASAIKAFEHGRLISPVIIEGLHQIGNSISTLRLYHQLGVRYATLTWNCHNKYADAALEMNDDWSAKVATPHWYGLSPAGRDLVVEMNRLGMLVDLAHVSVDTMIDVLIGNGTDAWKGSLAPPIFSHSSAYSVCPHPRNVPDEVLHYVKERNSVVMINFAPEFVSCTAGKTPADLPEFYPKNSTLHHVVQHIKHIGELIGYDHVGIGTDFDGITETPKGLEDVTKFPDLVAELLREGISDADVGKIVGRNILRVWKEADEVAARLQKATDPLEDEPKSFHLL